MTAYSSIGLPSRSSGSKVELDRFLSTSTHSSTTISITRLIQVQAISQVTHGSHTVRARCNTSRVNHLPAEGGPRASRGLHPENRRTLTRTLHICLVRGARKTITDAAPNGKEATPPRSDFAGICELETRPLTTWMVAPDSFWRPVSHEVSP